MSRYTVYGEVFFVLPINTPNLNRVLQECGEDAPVEAAGTSRLVLQTENALPLVVEKIESILSDIEAELAKSGPRRGRKPGTELRQILRELKDLQQYHEENPLSVMLWDSNVLKNVLEMRANKDVPSSILPLDPGTGEAPPRKSRPKKALAPLKRSTVEKKPYTPEEREEKMEGMLDNLEWAYNQEDYPRELIEYKGEKAMQIGRFIVLVDPEMLSE